MAPLQTDRQVAIVVVLTVFGFLSTIAVAGRLAARRLKRVSLTATDYYMFAAWIVNTFGQIVCSYIGTIVGGLGNHQQNLTMQQTTLYLQTTFASTICWAVSEGLLKISMCFFYLILFPQPVFRRWCYGVMGLCVLYSLSVFLAILLVCRPVQAAWDGTVLERCGNTVLMWIIINICNIITDFLVVFLPLPILWSLSLPSKKKIGLCLLFLVGLLICVITVVRIKVMFELAHSPLDLSYQIGEANLWPMLEQSLGIIFGCIPTLGPVLKHILGQPLDPSTERQSSQYSRSRSRRAFDLLSNQDIVLSTVTAQTDSKDTSTRKREVDDSSSTENGHNGIKVVQQWSVQTDAREVI